MIHAASGDPLEQVHTLALHSSFSRRKKLSQVEQFGVPVTLHSIPRVPVPLVHVQMFSGQKLFSKVCPGSHETHNSEFALGQDAASPAVPPIHVHTFGVHWLCPGPRGSIVYPELHEAHC